MLQLQYKTLTKISGSHIATYDSIPLLPDHSDPFDRLLIATAIAENIPIISADDKFRAYRPQLQLIDA
ncbi:MAG: PIN domain-containing protein [Rudanella sp.]|nr:PIN domain-containing protein [Rudanella sp.]